MEIYAGDAMEVAMDVGALWRRSWGGGRGDICRGCHGSSHGSRGPMEAVMGRRPWGYMQEGEGRREGRREGGREEEGGGGTYI